MNQMITNKVVEILEENGIEIDEKSEISALTSIQYISSLVAIEEYFDIQFSDEFLSMNYTPNIESFVTIIEELTKDQHL